VRARPGNRDDRLTISKRRTLRERSKGIIYLKHNDKLWNETRINANGEHKHLLQIQFQLNWWNLNLDEIVLQIRKTEKIPSKINVSAEISFKIHKRGKILLSHNRYSVVTNRVQFTFIYHRRREKTRKGQETLRSLEWNHAGPRFCSQRYFSRGRWEKRNSAFNPPGRYDLCYTTGDTQKKRERKGKRILLFISEAIFQRGFWPYRDNMLASWEFISCRIAARAC